jgi:putative membrane protein
MPRRKKTEVKSAKKTELISEKPYLKNIGVDITDHEKILIIAVDRDNDIGQKINVTGPIIGVKNNLKVATNFAIADPEDSDGNCIFGAIKTYKKLEKDTDVEIVTLTGHSKDNLFFADKNIAQQLKQVLSIYPATAAFFISDGAEDDQVIPLIQNYIPIISKETIIVRQSKGLESTFYTIKRALKDPFFARVVFGIPAIILLLFVFLRDYAVKIIAFLFGIYFLIKGFNLDKRFNYFFKNMSNKFTIYRISSLFYIAFIFFMIFAIIKGITLFNQNQNFELILNIVYSSRAILLQLVIAFLVLVIGNIIDLFYLKKMYLLGKNLFALFSILVFAIIIDFSLQFIIQDINATYFLLVVISGAILLILISRFTVLFDINYKTTVLLNNLPVYSKYGLFIGHVVSVDENKKVLKYKEKNTSNIKTISEKRFILEDGRILI